MRKTEPTLEQWSDWRPFPDPRRGDYLHAPFGPGVYDVRDRETHEAILFGIGRNLAGRMPSLLPEPLGAGTRNNAGKREFLLQHLDKLEYRTMACQSKERAAAIERALPKMSYRFPT